MSVQQILQEAKTLSIDERKQLMKALVDMMTDVPQAAPKKKRNLLELAGLGAEIWEGIDAQEYVNQLRSEWDHRP